jgi:hypothetical protein
MDSQGFWHNGSNQATLDKDELFSLSPGETVEIVKANGERATAQFSEAKGNRVVLRTLPIS